MALIFYVIEQRLLGGDNPPYPFEKDEMERFNIAAKLTAARRTREAKRHNTGE
ncbi:hypothetical protein [Mycolicibacterium septicum]|uniref:hypothetical protein n=1 Tax=Mycolicibacterium septicum TaxID=98668 RepID=UPI00235F6125|nr:hypothetical protein [Mycolicibacterium septicum]